MPRLSEDKPTQTHLFHNSSGHSDRSLPLAGRPAFSFDAAFPVDCTILHEFHGAIYFDRGAVAVLLAARLVMYARRVLSTNIPYASREVNI